MLIKIAEFLGLLFAFALTLAVMGIVLIGAYQLMFWMLD